MAEKHAPYGWIIDTDHIEGGRSNGTMGPRDISPNIELMLETDKKCGKRFRMFDDDGELYFSGRLLFGTDADGEVEFAPLDDFGTPGAGCTEIRYLEAGKWVTL
jgi:hypothetical protein